jgi:hypothetical protein
MTRVLFIVALFTSMFVCRIVQAQRHTYLVRGERYCSIHHRPLVTRHMFTTRPGLLVHYHYDRCIKCEERSPNHIITYFSLVRTQLHHRPATFTYCPRCEAEFRRCVGDAPCYNADLTMRWSERLAASVPCLP